LLNDYSSVTKYCSALEIAASNFSASGAAEFPHFDSHIPALANSLLSVKTLNRRGYSALFRPHSVYIVNPKEVVIGESEKGGNLYDLHIARTPVPMGTPAQPPFNE